MTQYKEFQGKTLDDAISEACSYFGVERARLEIDIVNDAKTGIFGLVGVKKALILARKINTADVMGVLHADEQRTKQKVFPQAGALDEPELESREGKKGTLSGQSRRKKEPLERVPVKTEVPSCVSMQKQDHVLLEEERSPALAENSPGTQKPAKKKSTGPKEPSGKRRDKKDPGPAVLPCAPLCGIEEKDAGVEGGVILPENGALVDETVFVPEHEGFEDSRETISFALDSCEPELVCLAARKVLSALIAPIVGETSCEVDIQDGYVRVSLDCGDSAGILVGRDGLTLAAIQYLAVRILAKELNGAVRLQIDVGNYRERVDKRLTAMAVTLGDRARKTGKTQSTRPLSAYHRRIVHLALEGADDLQTHSKGEGTQRRVVIQVRRQSSGDKRQNSALRSGEDTREFSGANDKELS